MYAIVYFRISILDNFFSLGQIGVRRALRFAKAELNASTRILQTQIKQLKISSFLVFSCNSEKQDCLKRAMDTYLRHAISGVINRRQTVGPSGVGINNWKYWFRELTNLSLVACKLRYFSVARRRFRFSAFVRAAWSFETDLISWDFHEITSRSEYGCKRDEFTRKQFTSLHLEKRKSDARVLLLANIETIE